MKWLGISGIIITLTIAASSQARDKSILTGTVYDAIGAVIPKAKVTAKDRNGEETSAETNDEGVYVLYLRFNSYSAINSRIERYDLTVDLSNRGFERFVLKDFLFIPSYLGKMNLDIALDSRVTEPCGPGGACFEGAPVITETTIPSEKILPRPTAKVTDKKEEIIIKKVIKDN